MANAIEQVGSESKSLYDVHRQQSRELVRINGHYQVVASDRKRAERELLELDREQDGYRRELHELGHLSSIRERKQRSIDYILRVRKPEIESRYQELRREEELAVQSKDQAQQSLEDGLVLNLEHYNSNLDFYYQSAIEEALTEDKVIDFAGNVAVNVRVLR